MLRRVWRRYNLGIVLFGLFFSSWVGQSVVGWREFVAEQSAHGQPAGVFGADGYVWVWGRTTLENWESEFLQLFAMVVLTAYLVYRGSPESKDGQEELRASLARIEQRLDEVAEDGRRRAFARMTAD